MKKCITCGQYNNTKFKECVRCRTMKAYGTNYFKGKSQWKQQGDFWVNPIGDYIEIKQTQDRDGENPFMFTAIKTDGSSIGTARGKKKILLKGRNQEVLIKKLKEMLK